MNNLFKKTLLILLFLVIGSFLCFAEKIPLLKKNLGNFEQKSLKSDFGGEWETATDKANNGTSIASTSFVEGIDPAKKAISVNYELKAGYQYRYIMFKINFPKVLDFSKYNSISFWLKGSGHRLKFHVGTEVVKDYDYHSYNIAKTTTDWTEYKIPLSVFVQEGWGSTKEFEMKKVFMIEFQTGSMKEGEKGWFAIGEIKLSSEKIYEQQMASDNALDSLVLISSNEDGFVDSAGGFWEVSDDKVNYGSSTAKLSFGKREDRQTVKMEYELGPLYKYRYAMARLAFVNPINLTRYKSVSFFLRGNEKKLKFHIGTQNVEDYDYYGYVIRSTSSDWKEYKFPLKLLRQEGWGKKVLFDLKKVKVIQFQTGSMLPGEKGWFEIDNLTLSADELTDTNKSALLSSK
jgi:hypothetical protein